MNRRVLILKMFHLKWTVALVAGLVVTALILAVLRPPPVSLCFVGYQPASDGGRIAYFCFSNDTPRQVAFLSDGSQKPYYQLVEYVTDASNPRIKVVTNYNFDGLFRTASDVLPAHSGVLFPVLIPKTASNTTVIVNFYPPKDHLADFSNRIRGLLNSSSRSVAPSYANLSIQPPVDP